MHTTALHGEEHAKEWPLLTALPCQTMSWMRNCAGETAGSKRYLQPFIPQAVPPPWQSSGEIPCTCWRAEVSISPFPVRNYSVCSESLTGLWWKPSTGRGSLSSLLVPLWMFGSWHCCSQPLLAPRTATAGWAFSAEQLPHKNAFCSTFPAIHSPAVTLPLAAPSFLGSFTQPAGKTVKAKCSFLVLSREKAPGNPELMPKVSMPAETLMPPTIFCCPKMGIAALADPAAGSHSWWIDRQDFQILCCIESILTSHLSAKSSRLPLCEQTYPSFFAFRTGMLFLIFMVFVGTAAGVWGLSEEERRQFMIFSTGVNVSVGMCCI